MTHPADSDRLNTVLEHLTEHGVADRGEGIRRLVNEARRRERAHALQARPYERTENRRGHANGFKDKTLTTRRSPITFDIPQVRGDVACYPAALQKGLRSEPALKLARAVLRALGIGLDGKRTLLGVSGALSEAEVHWRAFFQSLAPRGLAGVQCIGSDDHAGLPAARAAVWHGVPWQRGQFHLQQNAQADVPRREQRAESARASRRRFDSPDRQTIARRADGKFAGQRRAAIFDNELGDLLPFTRRQFLDLFNHFKCTHGLIICQSPLLASGLTCPYWRSERGSATRSNLICKMTRCGSQSRAP